MSTRLGLLALVVGVGVVGGLAAGARRRLVVVAVSGSSMFPSFHADDRVVVRRRPLSAVRVGDAVVIQAPHPELGWRNRPPSHRVDDGVWYIKRVAAVPADPVPEVVRAAVAPADRVPAGSFVVLGDNPTSVDSRDFGFVPGHQLLGVVVRRLRRRDVR